METSTSCVWWDRVLIQHRARHRREGLPSTRSPGHGPNLGRLHSLSAKLGPRTAHPTSWLQGTEKEVQQGRPYAAPVVQRDEPGHPSTSQFEAWDKEGRQNLRGSTFLRSPTTPNTWRPRNLKAPQMTTLRVKKVRKRL